MSQKQAAFQPRWLFYIDQLVNFCYNNLKQEHPGRWAFMPVDLLKEERMIEKRLKVSMGKTLPGRERLKKGPLVIFVGGEKKVTHQIGEALRDKGIHLRRARSPASIGNKAAAVILFTGPVNCDEPSEDIRASAAAAQRKKIPLLVFAPDIQGSVHTLKRDGGITRIESFTYFAGSVSNADDLAHTVSRVVNPAPQKALIPRVATAI